MAVPFRKISKTRGRMRRTHYKIEAANTVVCKNCGASIKPHNITEVFIADSVAQWESAADSAQGSH